MERDTEEKFGRFNNRRVMRWAVVVLIALSFWAVAEAFTTLKEFQYIGRDIPATNTISVSGEGEVFAVPDIATFTFGVTNTADTVQEAQEEVTEKTNQAIDALKKDFGVDDKDIKTVSYNVYPQYDYVQEACTQLRCPPGRQVLRGYEASQMIEVKVRAVKDAGSMLGALGEIGVTNVSGIQFTIDDEDELVREARAKAIADAKEKAGLLARDLGVRIVRVVSFNESGGGYPIPYYAKQEAFGRGEDTAVSSAPSVPTGENKITSNVTITYEIR